MCTDHVMLCISVDSLELKTSERARGFSTNEPNPAFYTETGMADCDRWIMFVLCFIKDLEVIMAKPGCSRSPRSLSINNRICVYE